MNETRKGWDEEGSGLVCLVSFIPASVTAGIRSLRYAGRSLLPSVPPAVPQGRGDKVRVTNRDTEHRKGQREAETV